MKKVAVLTGAGVSAESGISTFRDSDGIWEEHKIDDVATLKGWIKDKDLVLNFYNKLRTQLGTVKPNDAHLAIAKLEECYDVVVITQNVDDLHERAGSSKILHLHGELTKARSTLDPNLVYDIGYKNIQKGDKCEKGSQLRPHIIWFGESVPLIETAYEIVMDADIVIIIGTSMQVYPANALVKVTKIGTKVYFIDPKANGDVGPEVEIIKEKAGIAVPKLVEELLNTTTNKN